jgi:hypothetical protein
MVSVTQRHAADRVSSRLTFAPAPVGLFCWRPDGWLARFLSGSIKLRQRHIMLEVVRDMRQKSMFAAQGGDV